MYHVIKLGPKRLFIHIAWHRYCVVMFLTLFWFAYASVLLLLLYLVFYDVLKEELLSLLFCDAVSFRVMLWGRQFLGLKMMLLKKAENLLKQLNFRLGWRTMIPKRTSVLVVQLSCNTFLVPRWRFACLEMHNMLKRYIFINSIRLLLNFLLHLF